MNDIKQPTRMEWFAGLLVGHTANGILLYGFDYVLYPLVIFKLGLVRGGSVMALLSLATCLLTLKLYDWLKRDWLGIEAVKQLKHYDGPRRTRRWLAHALRLGDPLACVTLSILFDPFITTAYMRHGQYNGMNRRDWKIFLVSWLIANLLWTLVCFGGGTALAWLWKKLL